MTRQTKIAAAAAGVALVLILALLFDRTSGLKASGDPAAADSVSGSATSGGQARGPLINVGNVPSGSDEAISQEGCEMTPCRTPTCNKCTTENCSTHTMGCQELTDEGDRRLCEEVYSCFTDSRNDCVTRGDPLKCWCGTNPLTCVTDNNPPTQANGVCSKQVFAAAKSSEAGTIRTRFMDPKWPLGLATTLVVCRGEFCTQECGAK